MKAQNPKHIAIIPRRYLSRLADSSGWIAGTEVIADLSADCATLTLKGWRMEDGGVFGLCALIALYNAA